LFTNSTVSTLTVRDDGDSVNYSGIENITGILNAENGTLVVSTLEKSQYFIVEAAEDYCWYLMYYSDGLAIMMEQVGMNCAPSGEISIMTLIKMGNTDFAPNVNFYNYTRSYQATLFPEGIYMVDDVQIQY